MNSGFNGWPVLKCIFSGWSMDFLMGFNYPRYRLFYTPHFTIITHCIYSLTTGEMCS